MPRAEALEPRLLLTLPWEGEPHAEKGHRVEAKPQPPIEHANTHTWAYMYVPITRVHTHKHT